MTGTPAWRARYEAKRTTAEEAVRAVPDGGTVYVAGNAATPGALLRALAARRDFTRTVDVAHMLLLGDDPFPAHPALRHRAWFLGRADRDAVARGDADYVPVHLHRIPEAVRRGPPPDVALLSVAPPDADGFLNLGVEVLATLAAAECARAVIVQVNRAMPVVRGSGRIPADAVAAVVECDEPLPELRHGKATPEQEAIARHIAPLVPEGATLQLGIGGVPDAVLAILADARLGPGVGDLGIHSEMVSDGILAAVESGLVTGRRKTLHRGRIVVTFALGTRRLYDFLDGNATVEAHPADYVNDPSVIARNDRMVAVNSALQVDLTGQVCAESLGPRIWSGFGGQADFLRGAAASRGGVPIVALPSTAKGGTLSRIVPVLDPGAGVLTTRADVHVVATEHGAVDLFGKSLRERAALLVSVADPRFRGDLLAAARARRIVPAG
jgi:4-hydroxybutyrate CoA-transferase